MGGASSPAAALTSVGAMEDNPFQTEVLPMGSAIGGGFGFSQQPIQVIDGCVYPVHPLFRAATAGAGNGLYGSIADAVPSCLELMASVGSRNFGLNQSKEPILHQEIEVNDGGYKLQEGTCAKPSSTFYGDQGSSVWMAAGKCNVGVSDGPDSAAESDDGLGDDEYSSDEDERANDNSTRELMQNFTVGYSSATENDNTSRRTDGNQKMSSMEDCYASDNDGTNGRLSKWQKTSPLADNENIMGAIEAALSKAGTQEFMFMPTVGATFPSLGDAFQFYNLYSWEAGFSIRHYDSRNKANVVDENGDKIKIMQEFACQRAGTPGKGVKSTTMCGCPARLRLLRNKDNQWYIKSFVAEHNHDLLKSCGEKRHLTSHQNLDQSTKDLVRYLRENNVSLGKVNNICGRMAGSVNNLTFNKNRLKSFCSKFAAELIADDMQKTLYGLIKKREEDPNFVYAFEMDADQRITALMWSSGNSRKMYSHFGDAVTFDTTFNTNIYKMPFGMFVGVNNHFQSTFFAGVLLTREDTESFKWAFKTFVEMMGNKTPATILTDQCAAMGAAIRDILPQAVHRWCKWHVLK